MARALTPHVVHYVGDSAVFRCSITGDPAPTVTWSSLLEEDIVDGVRFISIGDTLAISNLTMMDNGLYYCNGANRHGQSSASVALTVKGRQAGINSWYTWLMVCAFVPKVLVAMVGPAIM